MVNNKNKNLKKNCWICKKRNIKILIYLTIVSIISSSALIFILHFFVTSVIGTTIFTFLANVIGWCITIINNEKTVETNLINTKKQVDASLRNNKENIKANITVKSRIEWIQNARLASIDLLTQINKVSSNDCKYATDFINSYYQFLLYFSNKGIKNIDPDRIKQKKEISNDVRKRMDKVLSSYKDYYDFIKKNKKIKSGYSKIEDQKKFEHKRDFYIQDAIKYLNNYETNIYKNELLTDIAYFIYKNKLRNAKDDYEIGKAIDPNLTEKFAYSISLYFKVEWDEAKITK
ncbi:hypothetical protein [Apilactobacillus timberlakei]|uniref:hypothetical protein n=1 Tax=Apilactobacillus timberlakei TaxID=2008380 RepID=UPI0015E830A3|nr:hypothetical protein [Apilactobacillus timberlakei]TPR16662.1 hypothetical protein DYZ95_07410 [Apilactobacillus timberlakei]